MKRRIALILAALMAVTAILAGCNSGKKEPTTGSDPGTSTPGTSTPKPAEKQELTMNLGSNPPNMDSTTTTDQVSFEVLANVNEGLIRTGKNFELLPAMAEKWEPNASETEYTFHLRKDAKWSDGQPVTAKDFVYAWLRVLDPKVASEYNYQLFYLKGGEAYSSLDIEDADYDAKAAELKAQVGVKAIDDYTLHVTLEQATPYWLGLMAFPTYFPVRQDFAEKHGDAYATAADKMLYNGPFIIESWVPDDSMVLAKNPTYWDAKSVRLEKVTFTMIGDPNTAIQMFETGELDRVGLPGDFIATYASDPGFSVMADATSWYLTGNQRSPVFKNLNVRLALNYALDRKGIVDNILKNGSVPGTGLVPPSIAGTGGKNYREIAGNMVTQTADLAKAKEHWELAKQELGVSKLTVRLLHADSGTMPRLSQGIQEMLQNALPGLTLELEPAKFAVRLEKTRNGDFDMVFQGWGADYNDPMTFLELFTNDSPFNDAKWVNDEYTALIKKAASTSDQNVRMQAFADAEKIMAKEVPILVVFHPAVNRVKKPWLHDVLDFPLGADLDLKWAYIEGRK